MNITVKKILMNVIFLATSACVVLLDQITKTVITERVPVGSSIEVIPNVFYITHVKNTGAAFGIFQNFTDILTIISFIAIVLIIVLKVILRLNFVFYNVSLGFLLGGALGNLVDRYFVGEVTDFFHLVYFAVFNIADSFILIGFFLIIIIIMREYFKAIKAGKNEGVE